MSLPVKSEYLHNLYMYIHSIILFCPGVLALNVSIRMNNEHALVLFGLFQLIVLDLYFNFGYLFNKVRNMKPS